MARLAIAVRAVIGIAAATVSLSGNLNAAQGDQLLTNGDIEGASFAPWTSLNGAFLTQINTIPPVYGGLKCLKISGRTVADKTAQQDVLSLLNANGQGTYNVTLYVKAAAANITPRFRLKVNGIDSWYDLPVTSVTGPWTLIRGPIKLSWSGTLQEAAFSIWNDTTADFHIDSVMLTKVVGTAYYVGPTGNDGNDGLSTSTPFATLQAAANKVQPGDTVYVMAGTYTTSTYSSVKMALEALKTTPYGQINEQQLSLIQGSSSLVKLNTSGVAGKYITFTNYMKDAVKLAFNGPNGINGGGASYIIIDGLEVEGAAQSISYSMAEKNRLLLSDYPRSNVFNGNGITFPGSHHVIVRNCNIHDTTGSGLRCDSADYVVFENNTVSNANWWTHSASSAMVFAASSSYDNYAGVKMWMRGNIVHSSWNTMVFTQTPFDPDYAGYGGAMYTDGIVDGEGLYTTRNNGGAYPYGKMRLESNVAFNNGFDGIQFHQSSWGEIEHNTIFDNGVFPPSNVRSSLAIHESNNANIDNNIITYTHGDPVWLYQSTGISFTQNLFIGGGGDVPAGTGNKKIARTQLAYYFVGSTLSYGPDIGDDKMDEVFGAGNIPKPAILSSLDLHLKSTATEAVGKGSNANGLAAKKDVENYLRKFTPTVVLDRGAYAFNKNGREENYNPIAVLTPTTGLPDPYYVYSGGYGDKNMLAFGPQGNQKNPDFENGITPWYAKDTASLASETSVVFKNAKSVYVSSRGGLSSSGLARDIKAALIAKGPGTFTLHGMVRNASGQSSVSLKVRWNYGNPAQDYYFTVGPVTVGSTWASIDGDVALSWTGTLNAAELYVDNSVASENYYADDFSMVDNTSVLLEAEAATRVGNPLPPIVPGGTGQVVAFSTIGHGITFTNVSASSSIIIRVATAEVGRLSLKKGTAPNYTQDLGNIYMVGSGADTYSDYSVGVSLAQGDTVTLVSDPAHAYDIMEAKIDYIKFKR